MLKKVLNSNIRFKNKKKYYQIRISVKDFLKKIILRNAVTKS